MHNTTDTAHTVLEPYDGDSDAFERNYGVAATLMKAYLEADKYDDIVLHPASFPEDGELWELPSEFKVLTEFDNIEVNFAQPSMGFKGFCVGWLGCGEYLGMKAVAEQNASPIGIWVNRKCLNTKS